MLPIKRPRPKMHLFKRGLKELVFSLVLGAVPVLANSESRESLHAIIETLLASPFFLYYYGSLYLTFIVIAVFMFHCRFGNLRHQAHLMRAHRLLGELSSNLVGAFRAGSGAILGFMVVWNALEPETINLMNVLYTLLAVMFLTSVCVMLAIGEEAAKDPRAAAAQR